jgi:hypothetical protein
MNKCKVVDLQNRSLSQQQNKPAEALDNFGAAPPSVGEQKRDRELEALMAKVDDEFKLASRWEERKEEEGNAEFEQFAKLAKFLSDTPTAAVPPPVRATEQQHSRAEQPPAHGQVQVDNPLALEVRAEIVRGTSVLEVLIDNVDFAVADAELLTSDDQIVLDIKGRGKLTVTSSAGIAAEAAKASFSRKSNRFKITVPVTES